MYIERMQSGRVSVNMPENLFKIDFYRKKTLRNIGLLLGVVGKIIISLIFKLFIGKYIQ